MSEEIIEQMTQLLDDTSWMYHSADGDELYKKIRSFDHSTGKVRSRFVNCTDSPNMPRRVLYNLHHIARCDEDFVYIVPNEECADILEVQGLVATTNPYGSQDWKPDFKYGDSLAGKDIVIMPSDGQNGAVWLESIL